MQCRGPAWAGLLIGLVALAAPLARAAERPMPRPVAPIVAAPLGRAAERLNPRNVVRVLAAPLARAAERLNPRTVVPVLTAPLAGQAERPMPRPVAPIFAASLAREAERLDSRQLDTVTAGTPTAIAFAQAMALGSRPRTVTSTRTFARATRLLSVRLRRFGSNLVLAESVEDREVEMAFTTAHARARGDDPSVRCFANVQFSGPPTVLLVEMAKFMQPQLASCRCTKFGIFALPS